MANPACVCPLAADPIAAWDGDRSPYRIECAGEHRVAIAPNATGNFFGQITETTVGRGNASQPPDGTIGPRKNLYDPRKISGRKLGTAQRPRQPKRKEPGVTQHAEEISRETSITLNRLPLGKIAGPSFSAACTKS